MKRIVALLVLSLTFAHAQDAPLTPDVTELEEISIVNNAVTAEVRHDSGVKTADVKFTITGPRDLVEVEEFLRGATFYVQEPEPQPRPQPRQRGVASKADPPAPVLIRRTMCQNNETPAQCPQPKTYQAVHAPTPFDSPVKAGGEVAFKHWLWIKAGDATVEVFSPGGKITRVAKQCTAAEKRDRNAYQHACAVKVGQPLYITRRWRDEVVK